MNGTYGMCFGSGSLTIIAAGHTRVWDQAFRAGRSVTRFADQRGIGSQPAAESRRRQYSAACITSTVLSNRRRDMRASNFWDHSTASNTRTRCWNTRSQASEPAVDATYRTNALVSRATNVCCPTKSLAGGDLWITEFILTYDGKPPYTVSIMEFRDDKVARETQYFADPFVAPAWRAQWVERMDT